jgi:hypothetical protein
MPDGVVTTGSTPTFELDAEKDDVTWDFESPVGAAVVLYLTDPAGAEWGPFTAGLTDPGQAQYKVGTDPAGDDALDQAGVWHRQWVVTQGDVEFPSPKIAFFVAEGR